MGMPKNFVLVRHGQSEGNIATEAAKKGDLRFYNELFRATPGHRWRLTETGRIQAATIGAWIDNEFGRKSDGGGFDRHLVSPYVRTRETAGNLALKGAQWFMNRALRERDWGDVGFLPWSEFKERYGDNFFVHDADPLYWVPPGGESIAQVAEDRVRNVLSTLHRENDMDNVIAVTHGEMMWAFRLVLERWNDEEFVERDADKSEKIHNCMAIHYTRVNPQTGEVASRLQWVRRAHPVLNEETGLWSVREGQWQEIGKRELTNAELLASVGDVPSLIGSETAAQTAEPVAEVVKDVHTEHCCERHGCKYGEDEECTVAGKGIRQSYPCEYCPDLDEAREALAQAQEDVKFAERFRK